MLMLKYQELKMIKIVKFVGNIYVHESENLDNESTLRTKCDHVMSCLNVVDLKLGRTSLNALIYSYHPGLMEIMFH